MKILGRCHIEIEGTRHRNIDHRGVLKGRNVDTHVRPEQVLQRLAPPLRLSEEVAQLLLFLSCITASRHFELDLAAQGDALNPFAGVSIRDAKFERNRGRGSEGHHLDAFNVEAKVRHAPPRSPLQPGYEVQRRNC